MSSDMRNSTFGLRGPVFVTAPGSTAGNDTAADAAATVPKKSRRVQRFSFLVVMRENLTPSPTMASPGESSDIISSGIVMGTGDRRMAVRKIGWIRLD